MEVKVKQFSLLEYELLMTLVSKKRWFLQHPRNAPGALELAFLGAEISVQIIEFSRE